jgi:predicted TIM-barrel fold metal-dependent hydrolase
VESTGGSGGAREGDNMPYAEGRTYYDADSHLMELGDWLSQYADPRVRDRIRPLELGGAGAMAEAAVRAAEQRRDNPDAAIAFDANVMGPKGWNALGAFDAGERSRALDLLGFESQLVFSTFAGTQFLSDDLEVLYGGTRAHNRAMVDFCHEDRRLIPVGFVPLTDPDLAREAVEEAIAMGCGAILVPSVPPRDASPTHPRYWPVWAVLEESGVPFMLHVGGGGRPLRRAFHENGKPPVTDFLGGGENIRSKDYMALHHPPEIFLACMVLDGIFEQFPGLRGGCIEQGALWVVGLMQRLDIAQATFRKTEPALRLPLKPSEYLRRQVKFTPFPTEPVGWLIEQAGPELFCFSSDYPHPEGGHDPLGRFEASLVGVDDSAKQRFYTTNYAEMMGPVLAARS